MKQKKLEDEFNTDLWTPWCTFWVIMSILTLIFAIVSFIYGPSPDPPTHMKSNDPYWYSGEP